MSLFRRLWAWLHGDTRPQCQVCGSREVAYVELDGDCAGGKKLSAIKRLRWCEACAQADPVIRERRESQSAARFLRMQRPENT